jgi:hypothetical protein
MHAPDNVAVRKGCILLVADACSESFKGRLSIEDYIRALCGWVAGRVSLLKVFPFPRHGMPFPWIFCGDATLKVKQRARVHHPYVDCPAFLKKLPLLRHFLVGPSWWLR